MRIKHNTVIMGKIWILVVILLLGSLIFLGCTGTVPRGWSGGTIAEGTIFLGSMDGELVAVPRGIFSAAGVMQGARGGIFMPSHDRPGVTRNIEKYYEKMGLESPFGKSIFRIDEIDCVDERNMEAILRSGVSFRKGHAKAMVNVIKALRDAEPNDDRRDAGDLDILKELKLLSK